jgi:cytochrome b561
MKDRPSDHYSTVAVVLHWLIAGLILWNVLIAWSADDLHGMAKLAKLQPHKTIGITVLILSVSRLIWRLVHRPPPLDPHMKPWERFLAHLVHVSLYVLMIGLPLSGWAMSSASKLITIYPIRLGPVVWPAMSFLTNLPADQMRSTHETLEAAHHLLAKVMVYGLVPLHILGALKHQFVDRRDEFYRMLPFLPRRRPLS